MNTLIFKFLAGKPKGVSNVARDQDGIPTLWRENGFSLSVSRNDTVRTIEITLSKIPNEYVETLTYSSTGALIGSSGYPIPTDLRSEILNTYSNLKFHGNRLPLSNIMASQIYGNISAAAQTATNFCYHMTMVIPTDAKKFRVALDNASTTLPFRIKSAAIATSDSVGPDPTYGATTGQARFTPQNGTSWTPITWDNGTANVEIAVAPGANRITRKWSDWITAPTVANTDGTKKRVVMMRFWVEGTTSSPGNGYNTGAYTQAWRALASNNALHYGYLWECARSTVDGVAAPANFQPNTALSALPFVTSFEYESYVPGLTINGIGGDSWMAGAVNGSSGNFGNGWLWRFVNELRGMYPCLPISMANNGVAAASSAVYMQRALDYIASGSHVGLPIYQVASQNDGTPTDVVVAAQRDRLATISAAVDDVDPVLVTCGPNTALAWSSAADNIRKAFRDEIIALRDSGRSVIDAEIVSDGATPARFPALLTTDSSHPNENGHYLMGQGAVSAVKLNI